MAKTSSSNSRLARCAMSKMAVVDWVKGTWVDAPCHNELTFMIEIQETATRGARILKCARASI